MTTILDKIDGYLSEKKKVSTRELESIAKELINTFKQDQKHGESGDIESMVEDQAAALGVNAEAFYEVVLKTAKKMGVKL
ncbi:MAG: hypothetical protein WC503_02945 [Candidatus Shapirobacteria bacterium]